MTAIYSHSPVDFPACVQEYGLADSIEAEFQRLTSVATEADDGDVVYYTRNCAPDFSSRNEDDCGGQPLSYLEMKNHIEQARQAFFDFDDCLRRGVKAMIENDKANPRIDTVESLQGVQVEYCSDISVGIGNIQEFKRGHCLNSRDILNECVMEI
jgi:hypothetical protein